MTAEAHRNERLSRDELLIDGTVRGAHVVPACWYVASFIDHNPEYRDLVAA